MKKRTIPALLLLLAGLFLIGRAYLGERKTIGSCLGEHKTLTLQDKTLLCETAGSGPPVVLLHGNGGRHQDLSRITRVLSETGYSVYALDSPGQGANPPLPEYHYRDMAEDIYEAIGVLGLEKPALYGWSDGGILGLLVEIAHPGTLSALAVSGVNTEPEGLGTAYLLSFEAMQRLSPSPLYEMVLKEPDITREELQSLSLPVLLTAGSDDMIRRSHTEEIHEAIPGSSLTILEGETHGSYITGKDAMAELLLTFLREQGYR